MPYCHIPIIIYDLTSLFSTGNTTSIIPRSKRTFLRGAGGRGEKGDGFEMGDWSQIKVMLGTRLVIWGHRKPLKIFDSDSVKALYQDGSSGC